MLIFFFGSLHLILMYAYQRKRLVGFWCCDLNLFLLFYATTTLSDIFNSLFWWWKIVSLRSLEGFSNRCSTVDSKSHCLRRVAFCEALFGEGVCSYALNCLFSAISKLRQKCGRSKNDDDQFGIWYMMYSPIPQDIGSYFLHTPHISHTVQYII